MNSGFPFALVFDAPGVSSSHQLGPEDDFEPPGFAFDVALYFGVIRWAARAARGSGKSPAAR